MASAHRWVIEQTWKHVLFLHWKVDAALIQASVPFELDLFEGQAVVSIVPFRMEGIRFPYCPTLPGVSQLWELNLRTYVKVGGVRGIYFITLDTDSKLGVFVAQKFFHLPYHLARIEAHVKENAYGFASHREKASLRLHATLHQRRKSASALDTWACERYSLFTRHGGKIFRGQVIHAPWELEEASLDRIDDQFSSLLPIKLTPTPLEVSYAQKLQVRFQPFEVVG